MKHRIALSAFLTGMFFLSLACTPPKIAPNTPYAGFLGKYNQALLNSSLALGDLEKLDAELTKTLEIGNRSPEMYMLRAQTRLAIFSRKHKPDTNNDDLRGIANGILDDVNNATNGDLLPDISDNSNAADWVHPARHRILGTMMHIISTPKVGGNPNEDIEAKKKRYYLYYIYSEGAAIRHNWARQVALERIGQYQKANKLVPSGLQKELEAARQGVMSALINMAELNAFFGSQDANQQQAQRALYEWVEQLAADNAEEWKKLSALLPAHFLNKATAMTENFLTLNENLIGNQTTTCEDKKRRNALSFRLAALLAFEQMPHRVDVDNGKLKSPYDRYRANNFGCQAALVPLGIPNEILRAFDFIATN